MATAWRRQRSGEDETEGESGRGGDLRGSRVSGERERASGHPYPSRGPRDGRRVAIGGHGHAPADSCRRKEMTQSGLGRGTVELKPRGTVQRFSFPFLFLLCPFFLFCKLFGHQITSEKCVTLTNNYYALLSTAMKRFGGKMISFEFFTSGKTFKMLF